MSTSSFKNYVIELLIVIIGITVAFSLNNMAEARKEKSLEQKYLADILADLKRDSSNLSYAIRFNEEKMVALEGIIGLIMQDKAFRFKDSLINEISIIGSYSFFYPESFTLQSLLQSGDFKLITNDPLKKDFLRLIWLYDRISGDQINFLNALDQNYYPKLLAKQDMITNEVLDVQFFYGMEFKNWVVYVYNDTKNMTGIYSGILRHVNKIIEKIKEDQI